MKTVPAAAIRIDHQTRLRRAGAWMPSIGVLAAVCLSPCIARAQAVDAVPTARSSEGQHARRVTPWRIVPRISLSETYSDNVTHAAPGFVQSGWMRDLTPGISITGAGPRVSGSLDYRLRDLAYANQSRLNNRQNLLSAFATVEAAENWLYVDARASVTQQNTSAFGAPAQDFAGAGSNRTETTVYQVSPYMRGRFGNIANYHIRFNQTGSDNGNSVASQATTTSEWVARVRNAPSSSKLGWSYDSNVLIVRNDTVGKRQNGRIRGSLLYDIQPELHASLIYGRENSDYATSTTQATDTSGFGFEWSPSARTQVAAVKERRSFGEGHSLLLSHRTPVVALKYTDTKDISIMPNQIAAGGRGSIQALMSDLLTSSIPDPAARAQAVRSSLGQAGTSPATGGFVTSNIFISRNREASAVLLGRRNTLTMTLRQQDSQSMGVGAASLADSFSLSSNISQQTASASWAYRLSAKSTLTNSLSSLHSLGSGATSIESRQYAQTAFLTSQVGKSTTTSIGVRRTRFSSTVAPGYRENAFVGSLSISF